MKLYNLYSPNVILINIGQDFCLISWFKNNRERDYMAKFVANDAFAFHPSMQVKGGRITS
jgi:hypothetical protein